MIDTHEDVELGKDFLSGGEMGRRIREFDWSKTALGPRERWSESLKNVVSMMLVNRFPMLLWWGKEYVQIYNDSYIPVLGMKHPDLGLGNPGWKCWDEIWDVLRPLVDSPFQGGPPTWMEDILLKINRNNRVEETHFIIAYSPVPDQSTKSGIGGVLATVNEITNEIIGKRQMETLRKLGKAISSTLSEEEVYTKVMAVFKENMLDTPFAMVHRLDGDGKEATLTATSGIDKNHAAVPKIIDVNNPDVRWKTFRKSIRENVNVVAEFNNVWHDLPMGSWDASPQSYVHLPISVGANKHVVAVITIALNPFRQFDDLYSNFVDLIADQVKFGVTNALTFKAEQERAEALAEIDKAKTLFFGNVSHEFRTPLTLMLGPINDLLNKDNSEIVVTEREVMSLVQRNASRLQKLVNTLLDFSRIEAGKYSASFIPLDISRVTVDLASNFRSLIEKAGIRFEVNCPPLKEQVYLDPQMWEKIVLNLVSNAFKFTFEGTISVKTSIIDNKAVVTVSDTGIGISPDNLSRLFERFHRVENARSRTHEGSGIGLALVNELVKLHGGTITVVSREGAGTTFTVSIPLGKDHLPADQIDRSEEINTSNALKPEIFIEEASRWLPVDKNETLKVPGGYESSSTTRPVVVLAEDNSDMQMYMKRILEQYCVIFLAANGRQALKLIKERKPDLVLTDVMMPEVDGFGVVKAMRSDAQLRTIPVILLSARAGEEAKVEGFHSGADDYLVKPFSRNELIARVNSNLQLSRVRKEVQQAVKYSEARFRALVTATSDVIYRMSPDWKTMRQLDGRSFLQNTGEPLDDWQEKYIHPKDRERVTTAIEQAIRTKTIFQLEHQVIRSDGTLGWTFSRAIPILDDNGDILEWFGAASDISDRKFYESDLESAVEDRTKALNKANTDLQVSNDDLQQFAHVASHDLKEPLRKIKTFARRLKEENEELLNESAKKHVEKVLTSAERMSTMIDGVLTYSSLNGGGFTIESIDLNTILKDIQADLELLIQQKQAVINVSNLPTIKGGKVLIHQLFYNLLNNSLKFSSPDRQLLVSVDGRKESRNGTMFDILTVTDNGIGFDQKQSEVIFNTFTRLHSKDIYDGTGLGLALCRKIVERHNGSITATGTKDVGSKFTISLPAS